MATELESKRKSLSGLPGRSVALPGGLRQPRRANLQYGLFAGKLADAIGIEVEGELVYLLSTFRRDAEVADGEVQLVMRPELRAAVDELGWFAGTSEVVALQ